MQDELTTTQSAKPGRFGVSDSDRRETSRHWSWDKRIPTALIAALFLQLLIGVSSVTYMYANIGHDFENVDTKLEVHDERMDRFDAELVQRTVDRYTRTQALADNNLLQLQIDNNKEQIKGHVENMNRSVERIEQKLDKIMDR